MNDKVVIRICQGKKKAPNFLEALSLLLWALLGSNQ